MCNIHFFLGGGKFWLGKDCFLRQKFGGIKGKKNALTFSPKYTFNRVIVILHSHLKSRAGSLFVLFLNWYLNVGRILRARGACRKLLLACFLVIFMLP